jgi:hypothetical protein
MGWHIYLEETMDVPFEARCIEEQEVSPLDEEETVRVVGKPSSEPSLRQQFVTIEWMDQEFGVPLSQLEPGQQPRARWRGACQCSRPLTRY